MKNNKMVTGYISDANMTTIKYSLLQISSALPFLIRKSEKQRKDAIRQDDKTLAFIAKALECAINNPILVTESMNMGDWKIRFLLSSKLNDVLKLLTPLVQNIEDTLMETGNEALQDAFYFFNSVQKASIKDAPGAKAVYKDLKKSFPKDLGKKI
ncbi:MAG: hypothetical protein V1904_14060 [Bacteroidota bacterium]